MSVSGLWLVLLSAFLTVVANLLLRSGVLSAGGFAANLGTIHQSIVNLLSQPLFVSGFALYALASLVWFKVISSEPLNLAYPLLVSLTFILVTLGATLFFKESITVRQMFGLAIIVTGIVLVSGK